MSLAAIAALYLFFPTILKGFVELAVSFGSPLAKWLGEKLTIFLDVLLEGAKDMLDNWKSMVFVATVAAVAGWSFHTSTEKCFDKVRKDWTLSPRNSVTKVVKEEDPLTIFFKQFGLR
jgi:hypothetical protein